MNAVFERYPFGGNEGMLALALADHAHDDGSNIWPSLDLLAHKAKMSRSTVQRLLRKMLERGWLEVVRKGGGGGRGDTAEYRICRAWIAGGELPTMGVSLTPIPDEDEGSVTDPESVDNVIHMGVNQNNMGVNQDKKGVTAMTPESSEPSRTNTPLTPRCRGGHVDNSSKPEQPNSRRHDRAQAEHAGRATAVTSKPAPEGPPWRWSEKRCGVEQQGRVHGVGPWDEQAYNRGQGEPFRTYRARVIAAVEAAKDQAATTKGPQC